MRHRMTGLFNLTQQTELFELGDNGLAGDKSVEANIVRRHIARDLAEIVKDVDQRQIVALTDLEVVEIMSRGDLDRARALFRVGIFIGNNRDQTSNDRQAHELADQVLIALILRVHGHRRVAQHGFRTGGRDHDLARAILEWIGEMPIEAVNLTLLDLEV